MVNLEYSEVQDRVMLTGRHMVRDVSCKVFLHIRIQSDIFKAFLLYFLRFSVISVCIIMGIIAGA